MAGCDDTRQLTEAQRQAGYQNQRTGVQQAVRPFSGRPTLDNLIDYINRELQPAVKRTRDKLNDVYLQVTDNAPSGNPLQYYFSTDTTNADPTAGRVRFDASPQDTATTIRVSESNARLVDARPWLEVMAGGATTPLGVVTLTDAVNPGRFIRFDLTSMVDQGAYWDLVVTVIESSHDDPFVDGGGIVISFIPGVASTGTTVPPGALTPIGPNTVLGNPTAATAAPVAIAVGTNTVLGRKSGDIVAEQIATAQIGDNQVTNPKIRQSAAMSVVARATNTAGDVADIAMPVTTGGRFLRTNTTGFPSTNPVAPSLIGWGVVTLLDLPVLLNNRFLANVSGVDASPLGVDFYFVADGSRGLEWDPTDQVFFVKVGTTTFLHTDGTVQREAISGDVVIPQFSNIAAIQTNVVLDTMLRDSGALSVIGRSANSSGDPADISAVAGSGAVLRESGSVLGFGTIATAGLADDSVTNAKLANMVANTVKANATSGTADPTDFAVGTNTVLGRVAANIVAAQLVNAQITDGTIANAKLANMVARTIKGRADSAGTGAPQDLTGAQLGAVLRVGNETGDTTTTGTVASYTVAAGANIVTFNGVTNTIHGFVAPTESGQWLRVQHIGAGTTTLVVESSTATAAVDRIRVATFAANVSALVLGATARQTADFIYHGARWVYYGGDGPPVDSIQNAMLRDSGALSVIGRSANTSGDPADISAVAASDAVLRESGSALGFGTIATGGFANNAVTNAKLATMAARRFKGRADSAGTGDPQDLTGVQAGAIIRFDNAVGDTTSTGSQASYAVAAGTNNVTFNGNTVVIHGITAAAETGQILWIRHIGVGTCTLVHESSTAGASTERLNLGDGYAANANAIILGSPGGTFNRTVMLVYSGSRWQRVDEAIGELSVVTQLIAANAVTDAKLRDSAALSVIGRSANSSGDPADIAAANDGEVLRRSGTALGFGTIATAGLADDAVTNAKLRNSGALSVIGRSANSSGDPADISAVAASDAVLRESGSVLGFGTIATAGLANNAVTDAKLRQGTALTVIGRSANSTGNVADIAAANDGEVLRRSGTALGFGTVATAGITDAAVTLAKMADLAQSRIIGRAESAGTGVPTALTPTQVVAIIDGEAVTWTGSHTFNGTNFTVTAGADVGITASGGTVTLAATTQVQITSPTRLASSVRLDSVGSTAATAANDLAINSVNVVRFTGGMDPLTGMVPVVDGQTVLLVNAHASVNMGIHIESGSSSAANRFAGIGTSRVIRPGEMALAWYDGADDRWRLLLRDEVDL